MSFIDFAENLCRTIEGNLGMNRDETIRLDAHNAPWRREVEFLLRQGEQVAAPVVFVDHARDAEYPVTFRLREDAAQQLMDSLWQCGLRPTEGSGSAGSLAATERHLKDMQELVGKMLPNILRPPFILSEKGETILPRA